MPDSKPITVDRIERALAVAAYVVVNHGDVYLPIFERLECELADAKRRADAVGRARAIVEKLPPGFMSHGMSRRVAVTQ